MPKDTKSSGYNKAPACESRGFGHKKEGENFDTPSFYFGKARIIQRFLLQELLLLERQQLLLQLA